MSLSEGGERVELVRLMVVGVVVVDCVLTLALQLAGFEEASGRFHPANLLTIPLVVCTVLALLWWRGRPALAAGLLVAAAALLVGPNAMESWVLVVAGLMAGARARGAQLALVVTLLLAYGVVFGATRDDPASRVPAAAVCLGLAGVGLAAGLVVRLARRARDREQAQVDRLARHNAAVRSAERERLAGELRRTVVEGLDAITTTALRRDDGGDLRHLLRLIDDGSRRVLAQLRVLLSTLRAPVSVAAERRRVEAQRYAWLRLLPAARLRLAGQALALGLAGGAALWRADVALAPGTVALVGSLVSVAVALRHPRAGALLAAVVLAVSLPLGDGGAGWQLLPLMVLAYVLALGGRQGFVRALAVVAAYSLLLAWLAAEEDADPVGEAWIAVYSGVASIALALAVDHFGRWRRRLVAEAEGLAAQQRAIPAVERAAVARDLHDLVAHQLSRVSLLVLGVEGAERDEEIPPVLDEIVLATQAAREELATLLHVMGPGAETTPETTPASVTATATSLVEQLARAGFVPEVRVDPEADQLPEPIRRTLQRVLLEGTTNILRYAAPGSVCRCTLALTEADVRLTLTSPTSGPAPRDLSLGWGLLGVRERVDLLGGRVEAGERDGSWHLDVRLPT